ncbi:MAG: outer membrane lipoprotein-sorting protein [Saprospirales bacterium]|nr:outer membrane lipoprotein-sorting protein [Saprospirales bacterium]MBK8491545.1 outer membrane lipoprotein-sorting protein [Saprospirales bacterium]
MKTTLILAILVSALLFPTHTWAQDARQLSDKAGQAIDFDGMEMVATLKITDAKGNERQRQIANASKKYGNTSKTLMKFLSPSDVKGTAMLIFDYEDKSDDMWIYLPALRKTRRIVSSEKSKSFMGSEFSNADMSKPNLDQFSYRLLGSATLNGKDCWKIEATCKDEGVEEEYGFSRKISFIEKSTYLTQQIEFYDLDGELFKVMTMSKYQKQSNGKYFAFLLEMENIQNGRKSVISIDKFQLGTSIEESYFSTANLEKL